MEKDETITIKWFLKFGSYENILDLYKNGTIYLNTIEYFRKLEDEELRGDKYEGASRIINSFPGSFRIESINHTVNYEKIHLLESYSQVSGNIYCLYCISSFGFPNIFDIKIDEQNKRFGTHCLIIRDVSYFHEQIQKKLIEKGIKYRHGFVEYYDKEKVSKRLTLFEKPLEFEYQKEFRFYTENHEMNPIRIQIGNLEKYASMFESHDVIFNSQFTLP